MLDSTPEQVVGIGGIDYWKDDRETYDNVHLIYSHPNGVKAKFTCLTTNAKDDYQIKVMGDKRTIILGYHNAWFYPEGHYEKEVGDVDGVSGATIQWEEEKGIPIEVDHTNPSKQALIDLRDSIINNRNPESNAVTGAITAIWVQMGLEAMYIIKSWNGNRNFYILSNLSFKIDHFLRIGTSYPLIADKGFSYALNRKPLKKSIFTSDYILISLLSKV